MPKPKIKLHDLSKALMHYVVEIQCQLIRVKTEQDLQEVLRGIRELVAAPLILVGFWHQQGLQDPLTINLDWPAAWINIYRKRKYHKQDPLVNLSAGGPYFWSQILDPHSPFTHSATRNGMGFGVTYKFNREGCNECQIVLSLVGEHVEKNSEISQLISMILPSLANTAFNVFDQNLKLAKLNSVNQKLFVAMTHYGLSQEKSGEIVNLSADAVESRMRKLREEHDATTMSQLVYRLMLNSQNIEFFRSIANDIGKNVRKISGFPPRRK